MAYSNGGQDREWGNQSRQGGGRGGGRYRDDDDRGQSRGNMYRDNEGRFASRDDMDDRDYGDYQDDQQYWASFRDRERSYGTRGDGRADERGEGRGWYGDSRGRPEEARRGWNDRDDYRGMNARDRDDDYRRGMNPPSRNYDDRNPRQGFFDGHSAEYDRFNAREDHRDESYGQGRGWFGDSRGHAEAARRGWADRDDRDRGRGRDDDDDRGLRSGNRGNQGRGGWFGDSRGHAEAARRGWEDRR
jgi:hypothetical protein